jgi:General secretion pathway, M protein.
MKQYIAKWQELDQKFIALTSREKVMISGSVVVLLAVLLFKAIIEPYLLDLESLNKTNALAQTNLSATNKQIELIQTAQT